MAPPRHLMPPHTTSCRFKASCYNILIIWNLSTSYSAHRRPPSICLGPAETIVSGLPQGGHKTRDVVFSDDGTRMFVSVGSRSNAGDRKIYAPWQSDEGRALVLAF